jgi:hypothetical protein
VAKSDTPNSENVWPGVMDEIEIRYVPVEYISSVEITFTDGNTWSIEVEKNEDNDGDDEAQELEDSLEELFEEYEDVIEGVNFILNVEKVKEDITSQTKSFMGRKK